MARLTRRRKALVAIVIVVCAITAGAALTTAGQNGVCALLGIPLSLSGKTPDVLPGCRALAHHAVASTRLFHDPRAALTAFDAAIAARPGWAVAHLGRGEAAETMGDFGTALAAYERAAELSQRPEHHRRVLSLASRVGRLDVALRTVKAARASTWERATAAFGGSVAAAVACAIDARARGGSAFVMCPKPAWSGATQAWRASIEEPSQVAFALLVEEGQRQQALALARERGWTTAGVDHCAPRHGTVLTSETSALLAMLVHPERADCALGIGVTLTDDGVVRLARVVLANRAERGAGAVAARAAWFLRYRLPAHDVPKLAEALNVAGYRLQASGQPALAAEVYKRAIAVDSQFSWPYHNIARLYIDGRQYAPALEWTGKALAANPNHWRAWRSHGETLRGLQRYGEAIDAYQRALRIEPNDAIALAALGRVLTAAGRQAEGLRALQAAVRLDPRLREERKVVDAHFGRDARQAPTATARVASVRRTVEPGHALDRARAAYHGGRYAEALREARAASDAEPGSSSAALMRAHMAAFMGELDEARAWHTRAATLAPNDATRIYAAATFALQVGEYDEALGHLDRLIAMQPSHVRTLLARAPVFAQPWVRQANPALEQIIQTRIDVLMEKGDLDGARRLARDHGVVHANGGYCAAARAWSDAPAREAALQVFRSSALGEPEAADCIWRYGQWLTDEGYLRLGRLMVLEGARRTLAPTQKESAERFVKVRIGPEVPKAAEQLFQIARQRYLRDGDAEGAARLFDEAARMAPGFSRPYVYRARIAEEDGNIKAALAWLERAIAADASAWRAHRNLGMLLARQERWAEAERPLRRALALLEGDAGARLALARALYAQGHHAEAVDVARAAVQLAAQTGGGDTVADVRAFLGKYERWGPGASLPPTPDPALALGWVHD